jgi:hypothetical protein
VLDDKLEKRCGEIDKKLYAEVKQLHDAMYDEACDAHWVIDPAKIKQLPRGGSVLSDTFIVRQDLKLCTSWSSMTATSECSSALTRAMGSRRH